MEENKIGSFIRDRRLQLEMTQQQLADKLGVTDKAVSKWERAVSYPDITLLRELAAALEVSVTELLAGERDEAPTVPQEVENVVVDTVAYAETARRKNSGWRWWLFVGLTAACMIAVLVMVIIGLASHGLWAALLVIKCIAFGWAVCYPLLRTERHPVRNALVIASVAVYPFLWSIGARRGWHLGIVVVSVAFVWSVYRVFLRYRRQKPVAIALLLLLGGLLHVSVNWMVEAYLERVMVLTAAVLTLDVLCLVGARVLERNRWFQELR